MSKLKDKFYVPRSTYEKKYLNKTSAKTYLRRTLIYGEYNRNAYL